MANLPEINNWETGIYQIEETDVVRGGPVEDGGISNRQALELANRTSYLYNRLGTTSEDVSVIKVIGNMTLGSVDLVRKITVLQVAANSAICDLNISSTPDNTLFHLVISESSPIVSNANVKITVSGYNIVGVGSLADKLLLYPGDSLRMVKIGNSVIVLSLISEISNVGEVFYSYSSQVKGVQLNGSLVSRNEYPRLYQWVVEKNAIISDTAWLQNKPANVGLFSHGNGSTTFRVPDLRGLFIRTADDGAGIDMDRLSQSLGSYQSDELKKHLHSYEDDYWIENIGTIGRKGNLYGKKRLLSGVFSGSSGEDGDNNGMAYNEKSTGNAGGVETRPKNVILRAYIKY